MKGNRTFQNKLCQLDTLPQTAIEHHVINKLMVSFLKKTLAAINPTPVVDRDSFEFLHFILFHS